MVLLLRDQERPQGHFITEEFYMPIDDTTIVAKYWWTDGVIDSIVYDVDRDHHNEAMDAIQCSAQPLRSYNIVAQRDFIQGIRWIKSIKRYPGHDWNDR